MMSTTAAGGQTAFADRLQKAMTTNGSLLCVGLDPVPERLPPSLGAGAAAIARFCIEIIEATADLVCCYKPNLGFFAALGAEGFQALAQVRAAIPDTIPAILDCKTGDMGNTDKNYARAWFDAFDFDAVTVNPYLGREGLDPFFSYADRGVLVLCRTSNPASAEIQDLPVPAPDGGTEPLYLAMARKIRAWSQDAAATVGLVVGATRPAELARIRPICPDEPILLPGIGAQGGELAESVRLGVNAAGEGLIVSASRSIMYAGDGNDFASAARVAAHAVRAEINDYRQTSGQVRTPRETSNHHPASIY